MPNALGRFRQISASRCFDMRIDVRGRSVRNNGRQQPREIIGPVSCRFLPARSALLPQDEAVDHGKTVHTLSTAFELSGNEGGEKAAE